MSKPALYSACSLALLCFLPALPASAAEPADGWQREAAPLLRKYCAGCHNADDAAGKLALDSYAGLLRGGAHGAVVTPGQGDASRMIRLMRATDDTRMPPEGEAAPSVAEIAQLSAWITAGAKGPQGDSPDTTFLVTPDIKPLKTPVASWTDVAVAATGVVAWATGNEVHLLSPQDAAAIEKANAPSSKTARVLGGHRGPVNAITFSADGAWLAVAAGEPALSGEVRLWNVATGQLERVLQGHRDSIYAVAISPDQKLLATGSYDHEIRLWNLQTGAELRTLTGHNGPVFDLAFLAPGDLLASASGDRTVKLWDVASGKRLDTLGQSPQELYALAVTPEGDRLAAGGVDGVVRIWSIERPLREGKSPLRYSRFAHEGPILQLTYTPDGAVLLSSGEDRRVKIWEADRAILRTALENQSGWPTALAVTADSQTALIGRLDGTRQRYDLRQAPPASEVVLEQIDQVPPAVDYGPQPTIAELPRQPESEPNDTPSQPSPLATPGVATGVLDHAGTSDVDYYRFSAKAGDQWILETQAERSKSPADTKLEVLTLTGEPIERLRLRAVRESELEFRGMTSTAAGARLLNYEELLLNRYVYLNGEIIQHFQQRRGPDSDGQFYAVNGKRQAFFDTSSRSHSLGDRCYFVEPYPAGAQFPDNGLPLIPIYFENDDESQQRLGHDSRLTFTAPADGDYLVRVTDARGFSGPDFQYELIVRRPQPDFEVKLTMDAKINAGSGKTFTLTVERRDNFAGPIRVTIDNLPPGLSASAPLLIEAGHEKAGGVLTAAADMTAPTEDQWKAITITATADIAGRQVSKPVNNFGVPKLEPAPKVVLHLEPLPVEGDEPPGPLEVVVAPGGSTRCRLWIERKNFDDRVRFDPENLPHGVIVDDIGLSGVLLPEGETERIIFLSAEPGTPSSRRAFHMTAKVEGNLATPPLLIRVE
ncbi:c-type cytochrome domain-containing protein [Lignipirellula cremea]|uniref:WD domain, G-beta repeat n=1 Tax=Lignipirellula cremea TaxID=2528010 RepID=A0A518E2D4_9BACT|nr:c-type cytochrome domain-containing protein [Lignipirellula cremea]QDU98250.1 WD domain, G-beta repeat [Lignipirellula cremea]